MPQAIILNPFAPTAYQGIAGANDQFVDQDKTYVYDVVLTANQNLTNGTLTTDRDADFICMAIQFSFATSSLFKVQFFDNQGQNLSNDYIYGAAYQVGGQSVPFPIVPGRIIAAGGNFGIRLVDLSGAENTIQILFRGVKRYRR
jgi:hypothetical protein